MNFVVWLASLFSSKPEQAPTQVQTLPPEENKCKLYSFYCGGFNDAHNCVPLICIPSYYDQVSLCFANPSPQSKLSVNYMCKNIEPDVMKVWAQSVEHDGIATTMTVIDSPTTHWGDVCIPTFVQSLLDTMANWHCISGFIFDAEGPDYTPLKEIIPAFREAAPQAYIGYVCSGTEQDMEILTAIGDCVDSVQIMEYTASFAEKVQLAEMLAEPAGGMDKIVMGVKCGATEGPTPLLEVKELSKWVVANGARGMTLYSVDCDCPDWTYLPLWKYSATMHEILH